MASPVGSPATPPGPAMTPGAIHSGTRIPPDEVGEAGTIVVLASSSQTNTTHVSIPLSPLPFLPPPFPRPPSETAETGAGLGTRPASSPIQHQQVLT